MEKVKLTRFIDKYHLGGNVNAVVINSKRINFPLVLSQDKVYWVN